MDTIKLTQFAVVLSLYDKCYFPHANLSAGNFTT